MSYLRMIASLKRERSRLQHYSQESEIELTDYFSREERREYCNEKSIRSLSNHCSYAIEQLGERFKESVRDEDLADLSDIEKTVFWQRFLLGEGFIKISSSIGQNPQETEKIYHKALDKVILHYQKFDEGGK